MPCIRTDAKLLGTCINLSNKIKEKPKEKNNNKEIHNKKTNENHTHTFIYIKTHRKGREFGLVSDGAVLLHKAAVAALRQP